MVPLGTQGKRKGGRGRSEKERAGKAAVNNLDHRSKPLFTSEGIDRRLRGGFAPAGQPWWDNETGLLSSFPSFCAIVAVVGLFVCFLVMQPDSPQHPFLCVLVCALLFLCARFDPLGCVFMRFHAANAGWKIFLSSSESRSGGGRGEKDIVTLRVWLFCIKEQ